MAGPAERQLQEHPAEQVHRMELEAPAQMLRILGHPLRLKIVTGLSQTPCCVKQIWECLGLPQAIVSQHLAVLKAAGIIEGKRSGARVHYAVVHPLAREIVRHLSLETRRNP